jgi:LytS/YehU family sensor histidine kinase
VTLAGTTIILVNDIILIHFFPSPGDEDKAMRFLLFYGSTLGMTCMISSVGVSIRALIYWIKSQHHLNQVQQEHLKTELTFLRSQMNPHFLFNAMNLIYGHIDKTNTLARQITLQFSDLLRYQLYECEASAISIEKEVDYLKQYVSLQKLRKSESFSCNLKLTGQLQHFEIPPLLMMPLVENAFKYVSFGEKQENFLDIELSGDEEQFSFSCVNSKCESDRNELVTTKGLGLQNLRRRLELLYPAKHELHIEDMENMFKVQLSIWR